MESADSLDIADIDQAHAPKHGAGESTALQLVNDVQPITDRDLDEDLALVRREIRTLLFGASVQFASLCAGKDGMTQRSLEEAMGFASLLTVSVHSSEISDRMVDDICRQKGVPSMIERAKKKERQLLMEALIRA